MPKSSLLRLLPLAAAALLAACAHHAPETLELDDQQRHCDPLELRSGQVFSLRLPSDPGSGFRWSLLDGAVPVLQPLGPEVYSSDEASDLLGGAGVSIWRFRAVAPGEGRLSLDYRRPWEREIAAERSFACRILVR